MSDSKKYCNLKCDINSKYQCHSPNKLNKQINVNKMVVTFDNSKFLQVSLICQAFTISCFYNKLQIGCCKFSKIRQILLERKLKSNSNLNFPKNPRIAFRTAVKRATEKAKV